MATLLGSLLVSLGLESGEFKSGLNAAEKQLRAAQKRIQSVGDSFVNIGAKMSVAVTAPLIALSTAAVKGFVEQQQAMADVNAALASMGAASGKTSVELAKTADALEMRSLFDAEIILKQVTANLLTFGNVAGEQFDRAQQAAVDMATRLGTEPQSAAIMLGKALNDPVKGITALTRVGIQFTEQQKAQIAAMQEAGNTAGAQGVILAEVERQFKGAAAAAADATPWRQAQVAIGQAMDVIGKAILPIIKPAAEAIASMASAFASLPEPVQKAIVVAAAIAAALGPVLLVVGGLVSTFGALMPVMTALVPVFAAVKVAALALMANPVILGFAAVILGIYLAWKNWDAISAIVKRLYTAVKTWVLDKLGAIWDRVMGKIEFVRKAFYNLYDAVVGHSYIPDMVDGIRDEMGRLDKVMVAPVKGATEKAAQAFRDLAAEARSIMDRLFPNVAAQIAYETDRATLVSVGASETAIRALASERDSNKTAKPGMDFGAGESPISGVEMGAVQDGLDRIAAATASVKQGWMDLKDAGVFAFREVSHQLTGVLLGAQSLGDALRNVVAQLAEMAISMAFKALGTSLGIPAFAGGTNFAPGGLSIVGERGPELVNLPRGSQVIPNNQLAGMGGGNNITVNVSGAMNERQGRETAGIIARRLRAEMNGLK